MSLGSVRELEALLEISVELEFISDCSEYIGRLQELAKMITSLKNRLKADS